MFIVCVLFICVLLNVPPLSPHDRYRDPLSSFYPGPAATTDNVGPTHKVGTHTHHALAAVDRNKQRKYRTSGFRRLADDAVYCCVSSPLA